MPVVLLSFTLLVGQLVGVAQAQGTDPPSPSEPPLSYDEAEAQGIDRMLMCPVCPAESIDQAQVEIARQMRRLVREMLSQGDSRDQILEYFADRYGPEVLAAPPKSGISLLAWVIPVASVLAGLGAGLVILRSMTRQGAGGPETAPLQEDDLQPYLEVIDRDLTLGERPGGIEQTKLPNPGAIPEAISTEPGISEPATEDGYG